MNLQTKIEKGDERSLILGRPIAYYRSFVPLSKAKVPGALMLSQAWYWHQRRGTSKSIMKGWFYKTDKDWQDETGLTLKQLRSARKALSEVGVLKCQRKGVPAKMHYQLQEQVLFQLLMANSSTQACVSTHACVSSSCAERAQQVLPKGMNSTETTTEITPEKTAASRRPLHGGDTASPPKSQIPKDANEVVVFSLQAHACNAMDIEQVLSQFGGFKTEPARSIVHKVAASEGYDSPMVEALGVAFRFIRYNNTHGWTITTNWRSAFRGFMKSGDCYGGMADVPMAWFAAIADEGKTF